MTIMDRSILIKGDIIAIHPGKHRNRLFILD